MAAIADADISIDVSGNIRWTGAATTNRHTVLELIQWLMLKQDDEQASGDDVLDITVETPFDRSTDQILTLNSPFNIDDTFALHLYDGSVSQNDGDDLYSGLSIIGPVELNTEYMILQSGKVLPAFWGTGINPESSPSLVFSRHLVKSREGGADIDGKRITVLARELGDQFRRFPVTLGTGNAVAAIGNGADIFNENDDTTIGGWTTVANTENFQELNIDGTGAAGQEYYSQWQAGSQTINEVYERTKWISQRGHQADVTGGTPTGADFVIENGTIDGQAQSFVSPSALELLTEVRANIKILAEDSTGLSGSVYAVLMAVTGTGGTDAEPDGTPLARSEDILVSHFTGTYEETIFRFNRHNPSDGTDQINGLRLTASTDYAIVFRHDAADATNNLSLQGASSEQDATMNQADSTAATWTASATDDIYIEVKSSPPIHGVQGEIFQGINIQVAYDAEGGSGVLETEATNDELVIWGTRIQMDGYSGPFFVGEYVKIERASVVVSGGELLYDDLSNDLIVALENPAAAIIADGDVITGLVSGATCTIDTTITDEDLGGGSGYVLAEDDNTGTGELYIQVVTGVVPVDNSRIRSTAGDPIADYVDATTASASDGINPKTIIPEFLGTSTGSNIIGAYGIGFETPGDIGSSDRFISLDDAPRTPPNNVVFTVGGLVTAQDRVLVVPRLGTEIDRGQWLLSTALTATNETAVVVKTGTDTVDWPANTVNWPSTGQTGDPSALRIQLDSGIYKNVDYESHNSLNTFTILSTDFNGAALQASVDNNVFMAFIDVLADNANETFSGVHTAGYDRLLYVRVRDGGGTPIKTFEAKTAQFLSTPQTIAATRTDDF